MVKYIILTLSNKMLHVCRRFFSVNRNNIKLDHKTKKIVDRFFEKNDKNGRIREALKIGKKEVLESMKKSGIERKKN